MNEKPTEKSPAIDAVLTALTGKSRNVQITANMCMTCEDPNMHFRTELDVKEYRISGMCQTCQDKVFGMESD
mgnify:CR=1 FL=1